MNSKITKYLSSYVSAKVIFVMDLFLSVIASVLVMLMVNFFASADVYSGTFAIWWICGSIVASLISMMIFKCYAIVIRHTSMRDGVRFVVSMTVKEVILGIIIRFSALFNMTVALALFVDLLISTFFLITVRLVLILSYDFFKSKVNEITSSQRVMVFGISSKSVAAITRFRESPHYKIYGFLSQNKSENSLQISDFPVFYFKSEAQLDNILKESSASAVMFCSESELREAEKNGIVSFLNSKNIKTLIAPSVDDTKASHHSQIRQVRIEDLLGRDEIQISMDAIRGNFKDKIVMVTGAAGSIGSELCRQLAGFGIRKLILFDNAETPMHYLRLELEEKYPSLEFIPVIGSVRHLARLDYAFKTWHPQVVFHAAAYKHVPLMEENPCEAVFVNVYGSRNVADKCVEYGVEKMVMISTDKAVNPTNIMGCSKRLAEIYVQSLGLAINQGKVAGKTKFVTTRFGNVLGSNGSVIPRFREQIENGGPVTVTHPDITRFFMTIPEACRLVMEAATISTGNQIFVFDMGESVKIADLAKRMIRLYGYEVGRDIEISYTGLRPGEKLYEEVLANTENTEPTSHDKIRIAKVREYDYGEACEAVDNLTGLARSVNIPELVQLMKKIVPEFKSKNSKFEVYDK